MTDFRAFSLAVEKTQQVIDELNIAPGQFFDTNLQTAQLLFNVIADAMALRLVCDLGIKNNHGKERAAVWEKEGKKRILAKAYTAFSNSQMPYFNEIEAIIDKCYEVGFATSLDSLSADKTSAPTSEATRLLHDGPKKPGERKLNPGDDLPG